MAAEVVQEGSKAYDVVTTLNYYDDPGDGSLPQPVVVGA
jgi:hypothetical protein